MSPNMHLSAWISYMRPIGILVWHTIIISSMGDRTLFVRTLSIWILLGLYASLIDPPLPG